MQSTHSEINSIKADFSASYNKRLPHSYYSQMKALEYQIPENAKPTINHFVARIQSSREGPVSILDVGCSYGVLSALIKFNLPLYALYRRYRDAVLGCPTIDEERDWFSALPSRQELSFYGIDISENAIHYAKTVGLLEFGVAVNLEAPESNASLLNRIPKNIDLIVSTGCVGYVTDATFSKILSHVRGNSKPIIISFVLRAFDFAKISGVLERYGYTTYRVPDQTFIQRKFLDESEQALMLSLLGEWLPASPGGQLPEANGYYYAELFISCHEDSDPKLVSAIL